jgi:outer membrane usher protein
VQAHGEATPDFANLGVGVVVAVAPIAMVSASGAVSTGPRGTGGVVELAVESRQDRFFGGLRMLRTYGAYDDLASRSAADFHLDRHNGQPDRIDQAQLGGSLWSRQAVLSMTYSRISYTDSDVELATASFSQSVRGLNFSVRASQDFAQAGSRTFSLGLSLPLGRAFGTSEVSTNRAGTSAVAEAQSRAPILPGEFGWRARVSVGENDEQLVAGSAMTPYGLVEGGIRQSDGMSSAFIEADGGFAVMSGRLFASKRIDGAFAVVDVGQRGVPVTHENRTIGVTGRNGAILVPDLLPYQANKVGVDARYVGLDRALTTESVVVAPRSGSGVLVRMGAKPAQRSARLQLVGDDGAVVPAGSRVSTATGTTVVVGYDGEVFFDVVPEHLQLTVRTPDGRHCTARVDLAAGDAATPDIGTIKCARSDIALR